jgi:LPXTG-motif cell wall-anchored protein
MSAAADSLPKTGTRRSPELPLAGIGLSGLAGAVV